MSLKTLGEDAVLGVAGLVDEFDEELGDQTTLAADAYGYFNPGTTAAAQAAEKAGGVDAAFDQTFHVNKHALFISGGLLLAGLIAGVYFSRRRR